jgi:hypothetical protein
MKFLFLSAKDTDLATPDPALLESVRRELLTRPDLTEVSDPGEADVIVLHEAWSYKDSRYSKRLRRDPIVGRYPQKLLTINGDDAANGLLRGAYASIGANRFDPLLHRAVPYHYFPNTAILANGPQANPEPPFLASWRGNLKSSIVRRRLHKKFSGHPRFKIETSESWLNHSTDEMKHYVDLLLSAKFSLCPTGWAAATFRIYESMALGVCPVILADHFVAPLGPDWSSFCLRVPEHKLPELESILLEKESEAMEMGRRARAAWERHFHSSIVISYYADALLACVGQPAERSPEAEFQRWDSWKMRWSNRWTVSQRITSKLKRMIERPKE